MGDNGAASEEKRREALALIEKARQLQQNGKVGEAQGQVDAAWRALEDSLQLCSTNHRARILLVSCAINAGEFERAQKEALTIYTALTMEQLQKMNDSVLHLSITHAAKMLGNNDEAIKYAKEATDLFPEDPQPYMILGELYSATGRHAEAEQRCRQALMHNDSPSCLHPLAAQNVYFTLCCLSASLVKQAKYSEAEIFLTRAVQIDDKDTLALQHLVDVYYFQARQEEALKVAQHICEIDPNDTTIRQKIDVIQSGHFEEASSVGGRSGGQDHHRSSAGYTGSTEATGGVEEAFIAPASKVPSNRSQRINKPALHSARGDHGHVDQKGHRSSSRPGSRAGSVRSASRSKDEKGKNSQPKGDGGGCFCCMERG